MSIEVAALRAEVKANQLQLQQQYEQTGDARGLLRQRSDQVDAVLKKLWDLLDFPASLAFAAVGGYGRGELYPASDIDLLILLPQEASTPLQEKLERLVGYFWDIGLEIGHSVRTVQECLDEADQRYNGANFALLEARLLTGHQKLFSTFVKRLRGNLDPLVFFEAKRLEQQERHLRFNETPYSVEPNCKESPGGLRDLQVIFWISKAAGYGSTLGRTGDKTASLRPEGRGRMAEQLRGIIYRHLRIRLHFTAEAAARIAYLFDYQSNLADQVRLGIHDDSQARL
jgi:[protein-PII] uridylyltransferase